MIPASLISRAVLLVVLLAGIVGWWFFEPSLILRLFSLVFLIFAILSLRSGTEILALISLYFGLASLYNLSYSALLPNLAFVFISLVLMVIIYFFAEQWGKAPNYFYLILFGLIFAEIQTALSFWPIDPRTKALLVTSLFYPFISLSRFWLAHRFISKKSLWSLVITGFILIVSVITSRYVF